MNAPIETERLRLRPFISDDVQIAFSWFSDPLVMQFTPSGPDSSVLQTAARIANYQNHQSEHGFSKWVIIERASDRRIGDAGLLISPEHGWIDFGYRLARPFWGQGLATEAAWAWIGKAFGELKLNRLTAIVHPGNHASVAVLKKLGFRAEGLALSLGMSVNVWALTPELVKNPFSTD